MTSYLESLLRDVFQAQGNPNAERDAELAARELRKRNLIDEAKEDRMERDKRIDDLRGRGIAIPVIAVRMGVSESTCKRAVFHQLRIRKAS